MAREANDVMSEADDTAKKVYDAMVVEHAQRARRLKQGSTVDCFDEIVLLMPLLAPAAS